jgi:hypothetical protein
MDATETTLTLIGTGLVLIAMLVELEHRVIWKNYRRHYHPHKNKFVDALIRPNKWVYALNVYVLWPLVFVLGLAILFRES